ncbi:conjugative transposon protein TraO [Tenacibaculum skagerrakense]|uniref:Conjugative transposon protein TraO n=1 Tax=Tenacibaculum skagerrakense TaxID=186571 RepID=A0A4R2P357_9FLAO|nr:conjugal transfer protein TraO [Tenacibaculum skagerrakense]TCP28155.1 conjugative transposon protein TraO [Tenacibaculum skagerrakense]
MSYTLRKILLGLILIFYIPISHGQSNKSVSALAGYTDNGISTFVSFSYSLDDIKYNFFELGMYSGYLNEQQTNYDIDVTIHTATLGYFKRLEFLSTHNGLILTFAGLGGVLGNESINGGNSDLPNGALITSKGGSIYGGFAAIHTNLYLTNRLSLLGRYTHFYHVNSEIGKSKFMIGLGLRYVLY